MKKEIEITSAARVSCLNISADESEAVGLKEAYYLSDGAASTVGIEVCGLAFNVLELAQERFGASKYCKLGTLSVENHRVVSG